MDDQLVVDFGVEGAADLVKSIKEMASAIQASAAPMKQLADSIKKAAADSKELARNMLVAAIAVRAMQGMQVPTGNFRASAGPGGAGRPASPAQALRQQAQMLNAQASMIRAQGNLAKAMNPGGGGGGGRGKQPLSFGQAVKNAIFSTRFTANNGHLHLMPLIGRTMQAISSIGPIGTVAAGAVAGIAALGAIAHAAAEKIGELTSAKNIGGGTYGETAKAGGLAAALGIGAGDVARMARELASRSASDPFAMQAAMKTGSYDPYGNMPGYGEVDKMKGFFKAVDAILAAPDDEAIRLARQFGGDMEKILDLRKMSPAIRDALLKGEGSKFGPNEERAAADYRGTMGLLSQAWDKLLIASTPLIDVFTLIVEVAADLVSVLGGVIDWMKSETEKALKNGYGKDMGFGSGSGQTAQERHTRALEENTDALNAQLNMQRQVFGGGQRAAGAVPANYRGTANAALSLGAFAL